MKEIKLEELKKLQCEVMQVFHDFCHKNNLKYTLACGSLLGAIRHNGYIPWDDDMDVYMQRDDYNKLIHVFPTTYESCYKLISYERSDEWCRPYAKFYDDRTVCEELKSSREKQIGINIDIFPIDSVPDDENEWLRFNKIRRLLIYAQSSKFVAPRRDHRSFWKNAGLLFLKILLSPFSHKQLLRIVDRYIQQYNEKDTGRFFETSCGIAQKKPFLKEDFERTIPHIFEGYMFDIMEGYHECLSAGFGDYMKLPPEENRRSTHYFVAYWK